MAKSKTMKEEKMQFVVALGKAWAVTNNSSKKFTTVTATKNAAIAIARSIAKNQKSALTVYKKDGSIQEQTSYANLS